MRRLAIAVLGVPICPTGTEHGFNTSELALPSSTLSPNVYTSIRGEVFDLSRPTEARQLVVSVVPSNSILNYGGEAADAIFLVQVCLHRLRVDSSLMCLDCRTVSPWIALNSKNNADANAQHHDFQTFTNDSCPDSYFERMVVM